ncbi:MAG: hypothetical protein ACRES7_09260 [Gammaproteobacteria bacterium]
MGDLEKHFERIRIPCGRSHSTSSLDDITRALTRAYPEADTADIARRRARARLRLAAESSRGILLLDHVAVVNTQMVGFLRRLRGRIVGVLFAVDVNVERDLKTMRGWHLGTSSVRMPLAANARLRRLFRARCQPEVAEKITTFHEHEIVRAAQGRLGWIVQCNRLIEQSRYLNDDTLYVSVLCTDTEIALRQGDLALLLPPEAEDSTRTE